MKILSENGIDYNTHQSLAQCLSKIGMFAIIHDIANVAKALNDFKPDLLLLKSENINDIVRAYCDKNKVKIISFGDTGKTDSIGDLNISRSSDFLRANLDTLTYKEKVNKTDTSIFINNPEYQYLVEFLCRNYNVKAYGPVKINSPKYLGQVTDVERYEILNKSNQSIVFNLLDTYDSILLDVYPVVYSPVDNMDFKTFDNLISLMKCMDFISDKFYTEKIIEDILVTLKYKVLQSNNLTFTIDTLMGLGFYEQANKLGDILEETKEKANDWVLN